MDILLVTFPSRMQARKLKTLLETTFGWDLEDNAINLIDEDDEVNLDADQIIYSMSLLHISETVVSIRVQFAPVVVEMDGS